MRFYRPARDGQSEPGATPFPRSRLIDSIEPIENIRLMFDRYSRPLVSDLHGYAVDCRPCYPNRDSTVDRRILNRVIQQVDHGLPENEPVAADDKTCVALNVDALPFFFSQHFHHRTGFSCESKNRNVHTLQLNMARVPTGKGEQAFHETRQAVHFFQHTADHVAIFSRTLFLLERYFPHAPNCRQRCPQFTTTNASHRRRMRPSAPWMKNARKSSVDIRSIRRQISRQCCGGWSRGRISQTERQQPATASPRCAEGGRTRRGSAGLSPSNDRRKAMIDHIYLPVSELERSSEFYKKLLEPLGIDMLYKIDQLHRFTINTKPVF